MHFLAEKADFEHHEALCRTEPSLLRGYEPRIKHFGFGASKMFPGRSSTELELTLRVR